MSGTLALRRAQSAPWLRDPLWTRARMVPSLDLRFAETQSLRDWVSGRDLVTFTRASNGTRVTSAGGIETLGNDVPRFTHDPVTGRCMGLLVEEARTNLLLNSATLSTQSVSVTATAHTLHFTGTGTVTLSGASTAGPLVGTGVGEANRVSLEFTPSAGTLTLTVSGTVSNAQLEPGEFGTSWISTTGSAATRAADIATITGSNFSSWYRSTDWTMYAENTVLGFTGLIQCVANIDGTNPSSLRCPHSAVAGLTGGRWRAQVGARFTPTAGTGALIIKNTPTKAAMGRSASEGVLVAEGGLDTVVPLASSGESSLFIGNLNGTSSYSNSVISRLTYWPRRLPDHILQELTR